MENCPVCQESVDDDITMFSCNHGVCSSCFEGLLEHNQLKCPVCRNPVVEYFQNEERIRIVVRSDDSETNGNNALSLAVLYRELTKYRIRYYCISFFMIYFLYLFLNERIINYNLELENRDCNRKIDNMTITYNHFLNIKNDLMDVIIYNPLNKVPYVCSIPRFFYNQCFNLV
tara:strand:- start:79 stop:597 length:519 start_codon:yes stop_codon:yes gene_type:complete